MKKIITILFLAIALFSCRSMKMHKEQREAKTDSTYTEKNNETTTQKQTEQNKTEIEVIAEYETPDINPNMPESDYTIPQERNMPFEEKKTVVRKVKISKDKGIELPATGLKKITIKGTIDEQKQNEDSTAKEKSLDGQVTKETQEIVTDKKTKGVSVTAQIALWGGIGLGLFLFIYFKKSWFMKLWTKFKEVFLSLLFITLLMNCNNPSTDNVRFEGQAVAPVPGQPSTVVSHAVVSINWQQSFYFAFKEGFTGWLLISLVCLAGAIILFILLSKNRLIVGLKNIGALALCLAAFLCFFFGQVSPIRWGNEQKKVPMKQYEKYKNDLPGLWDELYNEHRIIGTSGPKD